MAISLRPHQQAASDFIVSRPYSAIYLGVGDGKCLSVLHSLMQTRPMGHILVVAPVPIARSTWLDEIEKWQMPIRTKSLIVDDNDRELTKDERLAAFAEVPNEPPTMYFINQELLSRAPQRRRLLRPVEFPSVNGPVAEEAEELLEFIASSDPMTNDEIISGFVQSRSVKTTKKVSKVWLRQLEDADRLRREPVYCPHCDGEGCLECRYGLIDQLPTQLITGPDGKQHLNRIWPFQTVIIDESQNFKSHDSTRFQAMASVRPAISRLIELTGTPTPNSLMDLWSQIYLLDQGQALSKNITAYRNRWFTPKMVPGTNTPAKWIPNPGAEAEIYQAISHLAMSATNTSTDKVEPHVEDVNVTLPAPLLTAYKEFKRDLVIEIVKTLPADSPTPQAVAQVVAANQAVLTSKLQQFASGTLYTSDPDDPSTKGEYEVIHEEKIHMAEYIIRNNGGWPVLMTYHFKSDRDQLEKKLPAAGIDLHTFDGSRAMVKAWNAGKLPVMLLHPASGGPGLNLQDGGHTLLWYTPPFSAEHWTQTNGRLARTGQKHPVTVLRLLAKGTQDERMPAVVDEKVAAQDRLKAAVDVSGLLLPGADPKISGLLNHVSDDIAWATGVNLAA